MPNVSIDIKELSGITPGTAHLKDAVVWFYPYTPYGSPIVTVDKLVVPTTLGVATTFLPQTPALNGMWVEIRNVRLPSASRKFVVAIPASDCNLFDLPHLDPDSLDPLAPPSPAWVAQLAAEVARATSAEQTNATAIAAETTRATGVEATKVSTSTYTAGLALKQDAASLSTDTAPHVSDGTALDLAVAAKIAAVGGPLFVGYDAVGVADGTTNVGASFIAAATAAVAAGRNYIRVHPGNYHCPNLTPAAMSNVWIYGEGVTFTPTTYVYPIKSTDIMARLMQKASEGPERGRVSIVMDDAQPNHWDTFLPLTKELGITMGTAWPISNGALWIPEVFRHGWEIIGHGTTHEDFTLYTDAQVDTACAAQVAAISAITGDTGNIGFVYPAHLRNANTDRVASKYFAWGRGVAGQQVTPRASGHTWLVNAMDMDANIDASGNISDLLKSYLRSVARGNSTLQLYMHTNAPADIPTHATALRQIVAFCRQLGIQIVNPSGIHSSKVVNYDPGFELASGVAWTPGTAWSLSTTKAYRGTQSAKFTPAAGFTSGNIVGAQQNPAPSRAGHFAVLKASYRYQADTAVTISAGWGLSVGISGITRDQVGAVPQSLGSVQRCGPRYPLSGASFPASVTWDQRVTQAVLLGPDITEFTAFLIAENIGGGQNPFYVDDYRFDVIDYVTSMNFTPTLAGTTGVKVETGIFNVGNYGIALTAKASIAGQLYYTVSGSTLTVFSTNAADTTQAVNVVVTPTISYNNLTFPTTGA